MTSPVTSQLSDKLNNDGEDSSSRPFVGLPATAGTTSSTGTTTVTTSPQPPGEDAQNHAATAAIAKTSNKPATCCQLHGDSSASNFTFFPVWAKKEIYIEQTIVPLSRFAFTQGLQRSMVDDGTNKISISVMFVCKLHAASSCRYGEECKFVHVCRQFVQEKLSQVVRPPSSNPTTKRGGARQPHSVAVGNTDVAGAKMVLPPPSDIHSQMPAPPMPIQTQQVLQYPPHMNLQQVQQPQMIFQSQQIQQQPQQPSQMVQHQMQPAQQQQLMVYQTTPQQPQSQSQVEQPQAVQCLPSSMMQPPPQLPSTFAPVFVVGGPTQQAPDSTLNSHGQRIADAKLEEVQNQKRRKSKRERKNAARKNGGRGGRGGQQNQNPNLDASLVVSPELALVAGLSQHSTPMLMFAGNPVPPATNSQGSYITLPPVPIPLATDSQGSDIPLPTNDQGVPVPKITNPAGDPIPPATNYAGTLLTMPPVPIPLAPPIPMASGAQTHLLQQPQAQHPVLVSGQQHAVQCLPSSVMQPPHLAPQPPALWSFVAGAQQAPVQPPQGEYQQLSGSVSLNFSTSSPSHQPPPMTGALTHLLHTAPQQQ